MARPNFSRDLSKELLDGTTFKVEYDVYRDCLTIRFEIPIGRQMYTIEECISRRFLESASIEMIRSLPKRIAANFARALSHQDVYSDTILNRVYLAIVESFELMMMPTERTHKLRPLTPGEMGMTPSEYEQFMDKLRDELKKPMENMCVCATMQFPLYGTKMKCAQCGKVMNVGREPQLPEARNGS